MKRLAILLALFVLSVGCQKATDTTDGDAKTSQNKKANIVGDGKGNLSGGKGGLAPSVRGAAARTVNDIQLDQLRLFIFTAMTADPDEKVPNIDQIKQEIRQDGKLVALIKDEVIILTNTQKRDGIWAYTKWPQRGEKHYVITAVGREEKTAAELAAALKAQGTEAKLEK